MAKGRLLVLVFVLVLVMVFIMAFLPAFVLVFILVFVLVFILISSNLPVIRASFSYRNIGAEGPQRSQEFRSA